MAPFITDSIEQASQKERENSPIIKDKFTKDSGKMEPNREEAFGKEFMAKPISVSGLKENQKGMAYWSPKRVIDMKASSRIP